MDDSRLIVGLVQLERTKQGGYKAVVHLPPRVLEQIMTNRARRREIALRLGKSLISEVRAREEAHNRGKKRTTV